MVRRLGKEAVFETLKEARDFYNREDIREKIKKELSKDLSYKFELNHFSFYFRRSRTVETNSSAGEIRSSGEQYEGLVQARCFLGAENFPGLGQGYSVIDVMPSRKTGLMNIIKNQMEGLEGALQAAALTFSANSSLAIGKEEKGIFSYCFFDEEKPVKYFTIQKPAEMPAEADIENLAREISKKIEEVDIKKRTSNVSIAIERIEKMFVNSEGTEIIYDPEIVARLRFGAFVKTKNGSLYVREGMNEVSWRRLLNEKNVDALFKKFVDDIKEQKRAKKIPAGPYDILMTPVGFGTGLHEGFAAHLGSLSYFLEKWSGAFSYENVGQRIMLEDITIESDPRASGKGKWGYYEFDDEGMKAKKIALVKNGVLIGMLSDRESASRLRIYRERGENIPMLKPESNGHARFSDPTNPIEPRISNMIVSSEGKQKSFDELKGEFCSLLRKRKKDYGLLLECNHGYIQAQENEEGEISSTTCVLVPNKAYIVYPNGRTEPALKRFNISVQPRDFLSKIYAIGGRTEVDNHYCGSISGDIRAMSKCPAGIVLDMPIEECTEDDYKKSITSKE